MTPRSLALSFNLLEELRLVHISIPQCTFECVAVNFIVKWEHYPSSVRMFHLDVAASTMDLNEAETLQCRHDLPTRE